MMRPQHPPLPPPRLPPPLPPREHAPATFSDDEPGSESASATSSPRDDLTEESGFNFGEDAELLVLLSRLRKMTGGEPQNTEPPEIISSTTTRAKRSRLRPQSRSVIESSAFLREGDDFIERWKRPAQRRGSVGEERLSHLHPARTVLLPRSPRSDPSAGEKDYESGNEDDDGVTWPLNRGRSLSDTLQREQPAMIPATIVGLKDKKKRNSLIRRPSWFGQERAEDGQLIFPLCSQLQGEFKKLKGIP